MQNAALAQTFDAIADYHELAGDNPFKIRAYRRAGEAIAALSQPIEDMADTLESIEGLGKGTAGIAREFLATGQVRLLEGLKEKYPPGLLELLEVPGLGPKRVAALFEAGIGSVEMLKSAMADETIKKVAGFGPASLKNLENALQRVAQMTRRLPLGDALNLAERVADAVAQIASVDRVSVAGSVRRGCDTSDAIHILVQTTNDPATVAAFVKLPFVLAVEQENNHHAKVQVRSGIAVHLGCWPREQFGTQMFFHTGTTGHIVEAQQRAATLGLELWPEGVFKDKQRVAGADEIEIFALLGADFIAPELRESRGEWQAAIAHRLPNLITQSDIRGELHAHSTWSDGRHSIRQMVEGARARGYEYHVISDHSKALAMAGGLDAKRLRAQADEINAVQAEFSDIKILRGVECDILRDGSLDLDDEILHELDIVIASVHSGFNMDEAPQTARMVRALSHPAVDIVAHPTGRVLGVRPGYQVNVAALIEAAAATKTALEINCSERLDLSDEHAFAAREAGVLLSINTDAHSTRMLDNVALGIITARRAWCEKADILNTKSIVELMAWLKR